MYFDSEDFMWSNGSGMSPNEAANNANKLVGEWYKITELNYKSAIEALKLIRDTGDIHYATEVLKKLGE